MLREYLKSLDIPYNQDNEQVIYSQIEKAEMDDQEDIIKVEGYASFTESADLDGDTIKAGAYDMSLFKKNPLMTYDHKVHSASTVIGKVVSWKENKTGLKIKAEIDKNPATPEAQQVVRNILAGRIKAFSIGAYVKWNDKKKQVADKVVLFDVSVVSRPAGVTKKGSPFFNVTEKMSVKDLLVEELKRKVGEV